MDQQEPRKNYLNNLHEMCKIVKIDQKFLDELKQHSKSGFIEEIMKFEDDMAKKVFIFTVFTNERGTCDEMVKVLERCGQTEASVMLRDHNKSPPFMEYTKEIYLEVTPAESMITGFSKRFRMTENPRGKCIIINNVKDVLINESLRFETIFKQLKFDVQLIYNLSADDMKDELKKLSQQKSLSSGNAFIVMIISHGHDEKIICYDNDEIKISDIVDMFSEENCEALKRKPKLFFFNCCREKVESKVPVISTALFKHNKLAIKLLVDLDTVSQSWINKNRYTLICFTCAEGFESWFIPNEFTYFGQAFSHCIAQYSCDKTLTYVLNQTCERLSQDYSLDSPEGSLEIRLCKVTRDLYFNPGLPNE